MGIGQFYQKGAILKSEMILSWVWYALLILPNFTVVSAEGRTIKSTPSAVKVLMLPNSTNVLSEANMPNWRKNQIVGEWRPIQGSALALVPIAVKTYPGLGASGPESKVTAWNSFVVDSQTSILYSPANGGHNDYAGNEVDSINLEADSPAWIEVRPSTPISQIVAGSYYLDGTPSSRHTFYGALFNAVKRRIILLAGAQYNPNGGSHHAVDGFNVSTNSWEPKNTYQSELSEASNIASAYVSVASTGDIFAFNNFHVFKLSNSTNTWSKMLGNTSIYGQYAASAHDSKRNRVLVLGGEANDKGYYDIETNVVVKISLSGSSASVVQGTGRALIYEPVLDLYLYSTGSAAGTIYKIDPQSFAVSVFSTSGGGAMPPVVNNGVWGRFLYVPRLKGVVYTPTYGGDTWFLRTW